LKSNYDFLRILEDCAKRRRWNDKLYHFCISLRFHCGKGGYNFIKGDKRTYNIPLPSVAQLKRKQGPIIYDQELSIEFIQTIVNNLRKKLKDRGILICEGGIVFDEMEIRAGVVYDKRQGLLIGLINGLVKERDVDTVNILNLLQQLGKKVLQIFFISSDGSISVPLCYYLTKELDGEKLAKIYMSIRAKFLECDKTFIMNWSASDGFPQAEKFINLMKQLLPGHYHFYDYGHAAKGIRNSLTTRTLKNKDCEKGFNILTLQDL